MYKWLPRKSWDSIRNYFAADPNVPGFLLNLSGRGIIPPHDKAIWPAREYLAQHRNRWRL